MDNMKILFSDIYKTDFYKNKRHRRCAKVSEMGTRIRQTSSRFADGHGFILRLFERIFFKNINPSLMSIRAIVCLLFLLLIETNLSAQTPQLVIQRGHIAPVTDAVISEKHQLLITSSFDKSVKVWEKTSGKELQTFPNVMKGFSEIKLTLTNDERYVIAAAANGSLEMLDIVEGGKIPIQAETGVFITKLAAHPTLPHVAIGYEDGNLTILNYQNQTTVTNWKIGEKAVAQIQFSPDGRYVFARSQDDFFFAFDLKKQKKQTKFPTEVGAFSLAKDGKTLALWQTDSTLMIVKSKNAKVIQSQKTLNAYSFVGFLNSEEILLMDKKFKLSTINSKTFKITEITLRLPRFFAFKVLSDGSILYNQGPMTKVVNLQNINEAKAYSGYVGNVYASAMSAVLFDGEDRNIIVGGGEQAVQWWGEVNGKSVAAGFDIYKIKMNADKTKIVCSGNSKAFHLIDVKTQKIIETLEGHAKDIMDIDFVGEDIISVSKDKTVKVWSLDSNTVKYNWTNHKGYVYSLSTFKQLAVTGDAKGEIHLWDTQKGKLLQSLSRAESIVQQLEFSDDGEMIYIGFDDGEVWAWDWGTRRSRLEISTLHHGGFGLGILRWKLFIASSLSESKFGASISIYNVRSKKLEGILGGHESGVNDMRVSHDGKFIVSTGNDNLIKIWQISNQKLLATQYTLGDNNWAWLTPSGLFDASQGGMQLMHYVHKNEPIQLNQLKERYYEPDLLQKILGYNEEPIRNTESFKEVALYPNMQLEITAATLYVELEERTGGIGKVSVFINEKEIVEDANLSREGLVKINLKDYHRYMRQDTSNQIGVKVFNEKGWMESRIENIEYQPNDKKFTITKYEPKFYALVIGTSNYRGEALDLTYADKDAKDMANALELASEELFGAKNAEVLLLNTKQSDGGQPSKKNILAALQAFSAKVKPEDVFLLYLSGHGVNYGSPSSQFYYLTKEIASEDLGDEIIRQNYTISSVEFTNHLKEIPAQKQIMVLDACSSGSMVENLLSQSRSVSSSQKRALERMKDRTGVFILAGSAANKVSYEASQFGQGLLTYSLLSGMRGGALRNNQYVDVMQLFQYAADKVPELAAVIGGIQRPVIAAPSSTSSFDFGQVTDSVRYKIPLEEVKPLFIKSNFQHETLYEDVLDIGDKLDNTFTEISDDAEASIIFINVKKYPKAYSIKGRYQIDKDGKITLLAKLLKDKTPIGDLTVEGHDIDAVIANLLDKVVGMVE